MPTAAERYKFSEVETDGTIFFNDLSKQCKLHDVANFTPELLMKLGTKDVIASWLMRAVQLLDRQHNFVINQRVHISSYQQDIIRLQDDVIRAQQVAVRAAESLPDNVEDAIQTGLENVGDALKGRLQKSVNTLKEGLQKSYSEMAASKQTISSSNAISPEALKTVAKHVIMEEELSKNIMIFGLPETDNEEIQKSVSRVFEELGEKPRLEAVRLGKKMQSKVRPVKVTLSSSSAVHQILSSCSKLRQSANYKTVFLSPDRTDEERAKHRQLVLRLKEKTAAEPSKKHYIKGGEIVSVEPRKSNLQAG